MSFEGVAKTLSEKFSFSSVDKITIQLSLTNKLDYDVKVIQYLSYLGYVKKIKVDGTELTKSRNTNCREMRAPKESDYKLVKSKETLEIIIPLRSSNDGSSLFIFTKGKYEVELNKYVECMDSNGKTENVKLICNSVQFLVE